MFRGINVFQHAFIKQLCSNPDASADPETMEFLHSSSDHVLALSFISVKLKSDWVGSSAFMLLENT